MRYIAIPLNIDKKGLVREESLKQTIDESVYLLLSTPRYNNVADPNFGFVFNNMRFEIFDEHEGVVYNSGDTAYENAMPGLYSKKISGSSKNMNTFAAELKEVIRQYERRLQDVSVTMTYIREERMIYVTVKGVVTETKEDYVYTTTMRVWK